MKVKNTLHKSLFYFLSKTPILEKKELNLEFLELALKQALKVIYEYHINGKTILFIGFPKFKNVKYLKILNKTKHRFVSAKIWKYGYISNRVSLLKLSKKTKKFKKDLISLLALYKKPDLLVFFSKPNQQEILQEFLNLRIPVIFFTQTDAFNYKFFGYNINTDITKLYIKKFYTFLIYLVLKKTTPFKTKKKKINATSLKTLIFKRSYYVNRSLRYSRTYFKSTPKKGIYFKGLFYEKKYKDKTFIQRKPKNKTRL